MDPAKVSVIASVIFREDEHLRMAVSFLEELLGGIDYMSEILPFDFTVYYEVEMGSNLKRRILSFENLADIEGLHRLKLRTCSFERETSVDGKRRVNIDPGYLSLNQLVLFTTKNYTHRIYLGDGIYADLTLVYMKGSFRSLPWTYPDYGSSRYIEMFNRIRTMYKEKLRHERYPG